MAIANPFIHATPAAGANFTDREELRARLEREMAERGRRILLYGRRRMGKTSLLDHVAGRSLACFRADLSFAATAGDIADALISQRDPRKKKSPQKLWELVAKRVGAITISAHGIKFSGEIRQADPNAGLKDLGGLLDALNEWALDEDIPATIILDEFQDVRRIIGAKAEWHLRGVTQQHRGLNYIFAGSDHRLINWMTEPEAAFYKQVDLVNVGPIEPGHMARWIVQRFKIGGLMIESPTATAIVGSAGSCSGDIVRLARTTFDLLAAGKTKGSAAVAVVSEAMHLVAMRELGDAHATLWRRLTLAQTGVLRAIVDGKKPTAGGTLRRYGIKAASSAHDAIAALTDMAILARDDQGIVIFDNPFFRHWVAAGMCEA